MSGLTKTEINAFEQKLGHRLPPIYRKLLSERGISEKGQPKEIYHPLEIENLYKNHFEADSDLFKKYFPIGCDNIQKEIWLVEVQSGLVATIWHETHPDDYVDENWLETSAWQLKTDI